MKASLVDVVEACYRVHQPVDSWLEGMARAAQPRLDENFGVAAFGFEILPTGLRIEAPVFVNTLDGSQQVLALSVDALPEPDLLFKNNRTSGPCGTLSTTLDAESYARLQGTLSAVGADEYMWIKGSDPQGRGVLLGAPVKGPRKMRRTDARFWSRVSAHVAAGYRLRAQMAKSPELDAADAVLDPSGCVQHAARSAQAKEAQEALRHAARNIDRARTREVRANDDEALTLWRGLVAGQWTLVDHFDSDGRRFLVARSNEPGAAAPRAWTAREAQVVGFLAMGHPLKLIAYELGISVATVSLHVSSARTKLGLRTNEELIQVALHFADTAHDA